MKSPASIPSSAAARRSFKASAAITRTSFVAHRHILTRTASACRVSIAVHDRLATARLDQPCLLSTLSVSTPHLAPDFKPNQPVAGEYIAQPAIDSGVTHPISHLIAPTSSAVGYLVESDPRFANYRQWLGSDYLLSALRSDPALTQKRLGDGFYEQRLIREQIAGLTGLRFLGDYSSDEQQYKALVDGALTQMSQLQLRPGIALSAQQIAQLSSDIVWLIQRQVTLPDGRIMKALVPEVYLRPRDGDLLPRAA